MMMGSDGGRPGAEIILLSVMSTAGKKAKKVAVAAVAAPVAPPAAPPAPSEESEEKEGGITRKYKLVPVDRTTPQKERQHTYVRELVDKHLKEGERMDHSVATFLDDLLQYVEDMCVMSATQHGRAKGHATVTTKDLQTGARAVFQLAGVKLPTIEALNEAMVRTEATYSQSRSAKTADKKRKATAAPVSAAPKVAKRPRKE